MKDQKTSAKYSDYKKHISFFLSVISQFFTPRSLDLSSQSATYGILCMTLYRFSPTNPAPTSPGYYIGRD